MYETQQQLGCSVPDFSLPLMDSLEQRSMRDYLAGKQGAVVVFWSGVCTHCLRYDSYFNSFAERHPELGFVAIASRYGESRQQMQAAARERDLRFPILLDGSGTVARQWRAQQTPRCYLIAAADGRLLYRGAIDNFKLHGDPDYLAYLEPAIEAYLSGAPIVRTETASFGCAIQTVYYHLPKQL